MGVDAVFRPGIENPFSPTTFDDFLMGDGSVENPIVLDEEQNNENAPPTTPVFAEPPRLQKSSFWNKNKKVFLITFMEICFKKYYCVCNLI